MATEHEQQQNMHLHVNTLTGKTMDIALPTSATLAALKNKLAQELQGLSEEQQNVIFAGKLLQSDDQSLESMGVQDGATLTLTPSMTSGPVQIQEISSPDGNSALAFFHILTALAKPIMEQENKPVTLTARIGDHTVVLTMMPSDSMEASPSKDNLPVPPENTPTAPPMLTTPSVTTPSVTTPSVTTTEPSKEDKVKANEQLKQKMDKIKEQLRQKRLQRSSSSSLAASSSSSTSNSSSPSSSSSSKLSQTASTSRPAGFGGLRRGFLLGGSSRPKSRPARRDAVNPNACKQCQKKLGAVTSFKCRCGHHFCSSHRFSADHHCTFDYQSLAKEQIRAANPVILPTKVERL